MMTDEQIVEKILKGESLPESEIADIVYGDTALEVVSDEILDTGRWENYKYTVVQVGDRYFGIDWSEAATEMQENYYYETVFEEVVPKEVTVIRYVPKN